MALRINCTDPAVFITDVVKQHDLLIVPEYPQVLKIGGGYFSELFS